MQKRGESSSSREATFGTALKKFCLKQGRETSGLLQNLLLLLLLSL